MRRSWPLVPLPSANELLENDNKLHNLWHNSKEWIDKIPIAPAELQTMESEEILKRVDHLALSDYN